MEADNKRGRPTKENPNAIKLTVRVKKTELAILDNYCERHNVTRADGVRAGIATLSEK
jgi:hypothetical protein